MNDKQRLFVIEGMDGAGKATQTKLLANAKEFQDIIHVMSFPAYDLPTAGPIKAFLEGHITHTTVDDRNSFINYIIGMSTFYAVNRAEAFYKSPNTFDKIIVADRYVTSNLLHNGTKLYEKYRDLDLVGLFCDHMEYLEYDVLGLPRPDAVVYLKIPHETALANISKRNATDGAINEGDINETTDHLRNVEEVSKYLAETRKWVTINCTDPDGSMKAPEVINSAIMYTFNTTYEL